MASGATNIIPQVHLVILFFQKPKKKSGFEIYDGVNFEYLKKYSAFF